MRDAGLVTSGRGRGAGWSLARPAEQITLLDVYDALGQERPFALHPHEPNLECPVGFGIRPVLGDVYAQVESRLSDVLASYTVADLLEEVLSKHPLPPTSAR
jgi:DNA-binding IscR family transcriptional regulator